MRTARRLLAGAAAAGLLLASQAVVSAHPVNSELDPTANPLKGRTYTGVVEDVSPGGVPMEALSAERCEDGMAADLFPCHKVDLSSFTPLGDMESTFLNDVWGWEDAETGMQLAIVGSFEGTAFVDVTDGENPIYLGTLGSSAPGDSGNIWGDIRVFEDTAYIVSEAIDLSTLDFGAGVLKGFGIQVVDLTQFRGATEPIDVELTAHIDDVSNSHNVSLNTETGRLYVVGSVYDVADECAVGTGVFNGNGGALVYDLNTDANAPELAGCLTDDGYIHDMTCEVYDGPDTDYTGREICVGSNEDAVTIYDATDITDPEIVSTITYDTAAYVHQGWFSENQEFFFLGDEVDELDGTVDQRTTYIFDMTDLDAPELIGEHQDGNSSIDHNMFVHEGLVYQSNYTSGLWIYDGWKANQGRLKDRGFFDVFPSDDRTDFFGTWGNYPYFGDGKVVVTSSDEGLFVLQSRAKSSDNDFAKGKVKRAMR